MKHLLVILILAINCFTFLHSQESEKHQVKYTPEFVFRDGIYLNFEQVKSNNPLSPTRIVSNTPYDDPEFYTSLVNSKKIIYYDDFGVQQTLPTDNLWGISRNGTVFIKVGDGFSRVTVIGSICHFVANITTYNSRYYDPYYYNPYYYSPYSYNYNMYGYSPAPYSSTEMKQYLIDFETGKISEYDEKNLAVLLMKDPELHDEYAALKKKQQKQLKFLYIRKFNERNPLYLPVN
jgi:hypothetical protein